MTNVDLAWAAGLLEGEGYFTWVNGYPVVGVEMTDRDVVDRFAALFPGPRGRKVMHRKNKNYTAGSDTPRLDSYRYEVQGGTAIAIMLTLFPFFGERRRARIKEMVVSWRSAPYYQAPGSIRGRNGNAKRRRL